MCSTVGHGVTSDTVNIPPAEFALPTHGVLSPPFPRSMAGDGPRCWAILFKRSIVNAPRPSGI